MASKVGRPAYEVRLTNEDHSFLEGVIRKTTSPHNHVTRAKIALGARNGLTHKQIIAFCGASGFTVVK